MSYTQKFFFFRCYHCGQWYYVNKIIKTKKCVHCNKSFQFKKAAKFSKDSTLYQAIAIVKELKYKVENEPLSKYINKENKLTLRKLL
jgi:hypothetical protein